MGLYLTGHASDATDEDKPEPAEPDDGKDPATVSLGRRGGFKGGRARANKLTAEQRSEIARITGRSEQWCLLNGMPFHEAREAPSLAKGRAC